MLKRSAVVAILALHGCSVERAPHQGSFHILFDTADGSSPKAMMEKLSLDTGESYESAEFTYVSREVSQLVYDISFNGNIVSLQTENEAFCLDNPPPKPSFSRKLYVATLSTASEEQLEKLKEQVQLAARTADGHVMTDGTNLCGLKKQGKW